MKKAISLIVIVALMAIFMFGVVYAVAEPACVVSQAHGVNGHASDTAKDTASLNSVFGCGAPGD